MKIEDQYKRDIESLIRALDQIAKEEPDRKLLWFGSYSREDVLGTVFVVIKSELEQYQTITREGFNKLTPQEEIEALQEILNKGLWKTIPGDFPDDLVVAMADNPIEPGSTTRPTVDPRTQTSEFRLRAAINYWNATKAAEKVSAGDAIIPAKEAVDVKQAAKDEPDSFVSALEERSGSRNAQAYMTYISQSSETQDIASIGVSPNYFLVIPQEIEQAASILAVPILLSGDREKSFIRQANTNPAEFQRRTERQIVTSIGGPNRIFSQREQSIIAQLAREYREKLIALDTNGSVVFPLISERKLHELAGRDLGNTSVDEIIETISPTAGEQEISEGVFGSKAELIQIATDKTIQDNPIPYIPDIERTETVTKAIDSLPPEFSNFWPKESATPTESPTGTTTNFGIWSTPIGRIYIQTGVDEIATKNPIEGTALQLSSRGIDTSTFRELERTALAMGVTIQQIDLLKAQLRHIDSVGGLNWIQALRGATVAGINPTEAQALFAGGVFNYGAITSQHNFLGGIPYKIVGRIVGKQASGFIESEMGVAVTKKVAAGILGQVVSAIASVGGPIGTALSLLAKKVLSLAMIGIKRNSGKVLAGIGAVLGFVVGGPIGFITGGAIGAALGGVDRKQISRWIKVAVAAVVAVLVGIFGGFVVPLLITFIGIPVAIIVFIFIINSGAYVVPPSAGTFGANPSVASPGCPTGWPIRLNPGEAYLVITQGPEGITDHAQYHEEAIDIGARPGHHVIATHAGVATSFPWTDGYGIHVDVVTMCGGRRVVTRYAHLTTVDPSVSSTGTPVGAGQEIGRSGNTGNSTGPHLHYEFTGGITMAPPYIPAEILPSRSCDGGGVPCTTRVN